VPGVCRTGGGGLSFAAGDGLDASVVVAGALSLAGGEIAGVDEAADVIGSLLDDVVEVAASVLVSAGAGGPLGVPDPVGDGASAAFACVLAPNTDPDKSECSCVPVASLAHNS
jgi:hypothetical protein